MRHVFFSTCCMITLFITACNNDKKTPSAETVAPVENTNTTTPVKQDTSTAPVAPAPGQVINPVKNRETKAEAKETAPATPATVAPATTATDNSAKKEWAFTLKGTEPFWNMMITSDYFHFASPTQGFEQFNAPGSKPVVSGDGKVISFSPSTPAMQMKIRLEKGKCSDGVSDNDFGYKATVEIKRAKDKKFTTFTGCARGRGF